MRGRAVCVVLVAGCGRIGFDSPRPATDAPPADTPLADAPVADTPDAAGPRIACADVNLGSALGPTVAMGTTVGRPDNYKSMCGDDGGHDVSFGWFAPASGTYDINLCSSDPGWDSVLSVRDQSCAGAELACNDNGCGGGSGNVLSDVRVGLTAGQGIVIIVDGMTGIDGTYRLSITQE